MTGEYTGLSTADLSDMFSSRAMLYGDDIKLMDTMVGVYNGGLPAEYQEYFDDGMKVHVPNMIRLAWDDLAAMAGKVFPIYVRPDNDKSAARKRAEKQEQIGYGYNRGSYVAGGPDMDLLMDVVAWWMVGCANAVMMALPDYKNQTPYFTFRDPRTYYPPAGWSPFTQAAPSDALFAYQITIAELKNRFPDKAQEIGAKMKSTIPMTTGWGIRKSALTDNDYIWIGEYYHEDCWLVAAISDLGIELARSETGDRGHPGVQPVVSMSLYNPETPKGRSMFADQISIQAAMARMFSQKLDFFDRTLYPLIFHTPLAGNTIRVGPFATNEYNTASGVPPRVDTVAPAHQVDADQTMSFAMGLSRMLNRNPEMMQGGGQADSAKALNELRSGITSTIRDGVWPPIISALPRLYAKAAQMDINLWGSVSKVSTGTRKNSAFRVPYRPESDLKGRTMDFEVEPGVGLAGYQGTLEIMQLVGAELMPEDDALEQLPDVKEPQATKRRLQADRLSKVIFGDLAAKAQGGMLQPGALSEARKRVLGGEELDDVLEEMENAGRLMVQQQAPPEAGGLGGLLGANGAPTGAGPGEQPASSLLPLPTMMAIRGGPGPVKKG